MKGGAGGTEKGGTAGGGESAGDDVRVKDERMAWDNMMVGGVAGWEVEAE